MFKTIAKTVAASIVAAAAGYLMGTGIVTIATRKDRKKNDEALYDIIENYQNIVDESVETVKVQKQLIAAQEETINILEGKENK